MGNMSVLKNSLFLNKVFKSNATVYFLSITGAIFGFALNVVLSRSLSLEELDKVKYLISLCTLLSNIFVIGMPTFIIRESSKKDSDPLLVSKCFSLYFYFTVFAFPILFYILNNYLVFTSENTFLWKIVIERIAKAKRIIITARPTLFLSSFEMTFAKPSVNLTFPRT